jgi:hypothetical protein
LKSHILNYSQTEKVLAYRTQVWGGEKTRGDGIGSEKAGERIKNSAEEERSIVDNKKRPVSHLLFLAT